MTSQTETEAGQGLADAFITLDGKRREREKPARSDGEPGEEDGSERHDRAAAGGGM